MTARPLFMGYARPSMVTVPTSAPSARISARSGPRRTWMSRMYSRGTGSSHTVCQIPEQGVYHMPPRRALCLPRGHLGDRSFTARTARVFSPGRRA